MATALRDYQNQRLATAQALAQAAEAEVSAAQTTYDAARDTHGAGVDEAAALDAEIDGIRASLADPAQSPADLAVLTDELRTALIDRRGLTARLAVLAEAVAEADSGRNRARAVLQAARNDVTQAETDAEAAAEAADQHDQWLSAETASAFAELAAESQTLLNEVGDTPDPPSDPDTETPARRALIAAARDRIIGDIPEDLRDHARARQTRDITGGGTVLNAHLTAVEDAYAAFLEEETDPGGDVAPVQLAYDRAAAAFAAAAIGAKTDHANALGLLQQIPDSPALTAAEVARISAVALAADHEALTTEAALDDVLAQIRAAELTEERAVNAALLADALADPGADPDVQAARTALADLDAPLTAAQGDHTAALALQLDLWELAVPDGIWRNLAAYDTAIELLTRVATADLAALQAAFLAAENALVTALQDADLPSARSARAEADAAAARSRSDRAASRAAADRISVLRGDKRREVTP